MTGVASKKSFHSRTRMEADTLSPATSLEKEGQGRLEAFTNKQPLRFSNSMTREKLLFFLRSVLLKSWVRSSGIILWNYKKTFLCWESGRIFYLAFTYGCSKISIFRCENSGFAAI